MPGICSSFSKHFPGVAPNPDAVFVSHKPAVRFGADICFSNRAVRYNAVRTFVLTIGAVNPKAKHTAW